MSIIYEALKKIERKQEGRLYASRRPFRRTFLIFMGIGLVSVFTVSLYFWRPGAEKPGISGYSDPGTYPVSKEQNKLMNMVN